MAEQANAPLPSGFALEEYTIKRQLSLGGGFSMEATLPGGVIVDPGIVLAPAKPGPPNATTTSIEMPWRLILSPHSGGRWRHTTGLVTSPATQRTELWHSRLVVPRADGTEIEPPYPGFETFVFLPKDSPHVALIEEIAGWGLPPVDVVLEMERRKFAHGESHLVIKSIKKTSWVAP